MKTDVATLKDATDILRKRGCRIQLMPGPAGTHVAVGDYQYTAAEVVFLVQNGLKPGTRIWYRVVFNSDVPETEATETMTIVRKEYQKAGVPEGVEIFRGPATGGIVYYLSPQAAALLPGGLRNEATPCEKPDVSKMRKVIL